VVATSTLALVLACVMVLSPLGTNLLNDAKREVADGLQTVGTALSAMFPGTVNVGPVSSQAVMNVGVSLPLNNPSALQSFIEDSSTPGSAGFRQFLTPLEFTSAYAPSESSYMQLENYFEGYGLHVQPTANRLMLSVSGSPQTVGPAFHTSFANYRFAGTGMTFYGPTVAPQLPSSLGVSAVYGFTNALDNVPQYASQPHGPTPQLSLACTGGDTPTQIRTAYGVTSLPSGDTGTGYKIGIVDVYDSSEPQTVLSNDLTSFSTQCGLASANVNFNYPEGPSNYNSSSSSGWGLEEDIDLQWSHAMAPGATIEMAFANNSATGLYQAVDWLVSRHASDDISISWGLPNFGLNQGGGGVCEDCNATADGSYGVLHPILEAAAAEGIGVFVASGDCGADDGSSTTTADYPSSDEDATGVGGTVLTLSGGSYGSETGWSGNQSGTNCNNQGGAGGGWAPIPQPWYQYGYGVPDKHLRGVPDVGITAGTHIATDVDGTFTDMWGTSDAAPMWAGLTAIADQIHGGDVGLINPILYSILRSSTEYNNSFHEITTGNNGYAAHAGWEPISGVGTPIANVVVPEIANGGPAMTQTGLTAKLTASNTAPGKGVSVTFTATASGGTGTISHYDFVYGDGNSTFTVSPSATHSYASKGAYAAYVEAYDSSSNSTGSPFILISVGSTPFTVALSASNTAPSVGAVVTFTATPTGGTSPIDYMFYPGDGTFNSRSPYTADTYSYAYGAVGTYCAQVTATDSKSPADGAVSSVVTMNVGGATGSCTGTTTPTLSYVAISPTSPSVAITGTQVFTVTPTCTATCPPGITYAWNLTSSALGALNTTSGASVTFTAGSTVMTGGIFVNATLNGITAGTSTVMAITPPPGTLTSVSVSPTTPTVNVGGTKIFTAAPTCVSSCPSSGLTYVWALTDTAMGSIAGTGASETFTAGDTPGTVGLYVNATLNGITHGASTVIIIAPALTSLSVSPAMPMVAPGGTVAFTATPSCNPTCPSSGITYAWALTNTAMGSITGTGTSDTFTAGNTPGTVVIFVNATLNGGTQGASTVITVNPSLTLVTVSPTTATLAPGGTKNFTASPACSGSSCPTSGVTYAWALTDSAMGRISGSGASVVFTAGSTAGTVGLWVNATLDGTTRGTSAVITITPSIMLSGATLSPSAVNVAAGGIQVFTAAPVCTGSGGSSATCPSGTTYTWTLGNGDGNISTVSGPSTTFTAGNTAGVVDLTVTANLDGVSENVSATITISASGTSANPFLSGMFLWMVIIAVVAAVAIIAAVFLLRRKGKEPNRSVASLPPWNSGQMNSGAQAPAYPLYPGPEVVEEGSVQR